MIDKSHKRGDTKLRDGTIAQLRAAGKTCREIGKEVHLSHNRVAVLLKDEEIKKRIEGFHKYYITYDKEVQKGFMELCMSKEPGVRQKAISEYHSVMGITPSHTPSHFIQQIYVDNRQINVGDHSELGALLELKRTQDLKAQDEDVIDVEEVKKE